ncbi:Toxoplasma gondii family E protein, partial [Toxoplasma gondii RUB]
LSGGRRKKKGASVAPQTGQTTTGEAPRSAVDSEGGRAGPLAASDKNKAGTDEGGRDAKGDEDGEATTAGPRAGAQHTGEHGGETEVVGETVKVAEADEEGSDAAAQREALRTGARPKTSSAAGRRKQKMKEQHSEQVESISFPVSASGEGHDEQTTQSRGRRRQRMFRHDVRPVAEGVPNSSEAIGGRADGKRDHNVGVSSGVGGKGSEVDEDTPSPFPDVAALVTGLHRKLISAQVEYQHLLERIKGELGGEEFIAIVRSAGFAKRIFSSSEFYFLTKVILLTEETNFQLQALLNVARHLHEKALEQRESDGGDKSKDDPKRAAAKGRAVGAVSRDMEESPFSAVLTAIDKRSVTARKILLELLRADTRFRSLIIARSHLPSLPDFQLPPFPNERGYNPNSKNIVHTSAGVPLRAADPESVVMLLKDEVEQWESQVESVVSAVEAKWWIPPSDPDEARRQQERTAAVFGIASAFLSLRVVEVAASRWRRLNDRTPVSDPALQAKVQAALSMLDGFHDEYIQRKDRHFNAYCDSYSATARANVRHPQRRWDPLPNNAHAPDIRGAAAAEVRNVHEAPESMTEELPDADNLPKTDGKQEADGPTS